MNDQNDIIQSNTREKLIVAAVVFVLALFLRLLHAFAIEALPTFGYLTFDLWHINALASSIAQGQTLGHEAVFKAPLYPLVLGQLYKFFTNSLLTVMAIQGVIGSLSAVMIYLIAAEMYARRIAITAGAVAAVYGTFIYFDNELLPVTVTIFLLVAALLLLMKYSASRRPFELAAAGIAMGLAGAATPETLLFLPAVVWWILKDKTTRKASMAPVLIVVAATLVATVPFAIRNYSLGGEKVPYITEVGVRMAIANQEGAAGRSFVLPNSPVELGQSYANAIDATYRTNTRELALSQMGSFWLKKSLWYIVSNPFDWLKTEFCKLANAVSGYEISTDKPIYYVAQQSFPLRYLLWDKVIAFPFGLLLPLACLALFARAGDHRLQLLLIFYAVSAVIAILLLDVFAYERVLLAPVVIIWAAAGFWGLVSLYRNGDFRRFYQAMGVFVIALIVVNGAAPLLGVSQKTDSEFEGRMFKANSLLAATRLDEAEIEYESAMRLQPRSPRPYNSLAGIYAREGKDSLATLNFRRAVGLDPADHRPLRGVANILKRRQKIGELNQLLVDVIRDFPKANWAYHEYAQLHLQLEEYTQAADIYERSYAADSTDLDAIFARAETYLTADMRQEAEEEFKRYLEKVPSSIDARANLGQVYARQRRIDEALREFEYVRGVQPGNPAVYFNLAAVYYQVDSLDRAKSYIDTARSMDPTFPGLTEMTHMLDSAKAAQLK